MTIPADFLDSLRSRITLSAVVGRRVKLTGRRGEWQGLCPFHAEKTPSFTVSDSKGFYHCFGCGAHGDAVGWVQRADGLDFLAAVERLAADAGLSVPQATPEDRAWAQRRASLHQVLEEACGLFERRLRHPAGAAGLAYLQERGLTEETISRWRLGWADDSTIAALRGTGLSDDRLVEAGLLARRDDGQITPVFRQRITFPIGDASGRVIAFGARTLGDGPPKYLNSPDTPLFHKGSVLFGLAQARGGVTKTLVVVEGYMDVIAMHQAELDHAVAPLGTAITAEQVRTLWRLADSLVLCLDGDDAGRRAMDRAIDRVLPLLTPGKTLRFALLGDGKTKVDPDGLIRSGQTAVLRDALDSPRPLIDLLWLRAARRHGRETPEGAAALERDLYASVAAIADGPVRRAYLCEIRRRLTDEMGPPLPRLRRGRSKRSVAPLPRDGRLADIWKQAVADAGAVRTWLEKLGCDWSGLETALGGVGFCRGRVVKGKWVDGWGCGAAPSLWEPWAGDLGLVILPAWIDAPETDDPDAPDAPSDLLDLVGWDPHSGDLHLLTGTAIVLGEDLIAEAEGFEARGLFQPVPVAEGPLSWLQRLSRGGRSLLLCDWGRAWEALGGLRGLVAETIELGERLEKAVRPPEPPRPKIMVMGDTV